jgi:hypothetical protein
MALGCSAKILGDLACSYPSDAGDYVDVRYWHKADIPLRSTNVRFWGKANLAKRTWRICQYKR